MTNDGHSWADFSTYCSSGSLYSPYCKLHSSTPPKILIERVAVHPIDSAWHAFLVTSTGWCSVTCRSKFAEIYSRRLQHLCWFVGPLLCERDLKEGTSVFFFFVICLFLFICLILIAPKDIKLYIFYIRFCSIDFRRLLAVHRLQYFKLTVAKFLLFYKRLCMKIKTWYKKCIWCAKQSYVEPYAIKTS